MLTDALIDRIYLKKVVLFCEVRNEILLSYM